jgi:hypothetical protein
MGGISPRFARPRMGRNGDMTRWRAARWGEKILVGRRALVTDLRSLKIRDGERKKRGKLNECGWSQSIMEEKKSWQRSVGNDVA